MAWDRRMTPRVPGHGVPVRPTYDDIAPHPQLRHANGHHPNNSWDDVQSLDSGLSGFQFRFDNKLPPSTPHSRSSLSLQEPIREKPDAVVETVGQIYSDLSLQPTGGSNRPVQGKSSNLWKSFLLITVPILVPPVVVLSLILTYREQYEKGSFPGAIPIDQSNRFYAFVHFRDTWLVFVVSVINFWTPVLASVIMAVFAPHVACRLRMASATATSHHMPTPFEMRLIAGVCQSSPVQFFKAYRHCFWGRGRQVPPALKIAASMSLLLNLLWVFSFTSVALLHYCTQTVTFQKIVPHPEWSALPGRMLSDTCLSFNRTKNLYPCSFNGTSPTLPEEQRESWRLAHQDSATSVIQYVRPDRNQALELAILTPTAQAVGDNIDYRTHSVAVSTECSYITADCDMRYASQNYSNPETYQTLFNCSKNFYGALGKYPVSANLANSAGDPDICPLCYKPTARTSLAYFSDSALNSTYNSVGYDPATLYPSARIGPLPDSRLVNPAYLGLAARISYTGFGSKFNRTPEIFAAAHTYIEFAMQCKLSTYDVEYTSTGGSVRDVTYNLSPNGTLFEIFHGSQFYPLTTSSTDDIQVIMDQVQLQSSLPETRSQFERLFSNKMLSLVGSVLSTRQATTIQARQAILVSQIPWPAIIGVVLFPAIYTILGLCVLYSVRQRNVVGAIEHRDHILGEQISTAGRVWGAFFPRDIALQLQKNESSSQNVWSTSETRVQVETVDAEHCQLKLASVPRSEVF